VLHVVSDKVVFVFCLWRWIAYIVVNYVIVV